MSVLVPGRARPQPYPRRVRRTALGLGLDTVDGDRRRRVRSDKRLLLCGEVPGRLARKLEAAGATLAHAHEPADALTRLASDSYDAVLLDPGSAGAGLTLAKALKFGAGVDGVELSILTAARAAHRMTPLFVLPMAGELEYGIIVFPPDLAFLQDGVQLPLLTAVLHLDLDELLRGGSGLA